MTIREVAREWRQSEASVYRKVASGKLRAVRLGDESAALRIPRAELERIYTNACDSSRSQTPVERRVPESSSAEARQLAGAETERRTA